MTTPLQQTLSRSQAGNVIDTFMRAPANESFTLDEMRARLPAIFAPQPHESRSDRYVYINTADVLAELMKADFVPVEARMARTKNESKQPYTKHLVRLRHRSDLEERSLRKVGDCSFETILRNSHDGSSRYQFLAGILRLACLNGMVVSDGDLASVNIMHLGNRQKQLDAVLEGAHAVLDQGSTVMDKIRSWQNIELHDDEITMLAEAVHAARFANAKGEITTPITPQQLLLPRRPDDIGNDLWRTFNRLQENVSRGGITAMGVDAQGRPHRATTRAVRGIDGDVKLNRQLWQIASKMAELKA